MWHIDVDWSALAASIPHSPRCPRTASAALGRAGELPGFRARAFPATPLLPSLGNHDYWKTSQFRPPPASDWLLANVSAEWGPLLGQPALATLRQFGGYVQPLRPGLEVMSLNTLMYDVDNLNAYDPLLGADPMGQFQW